MIRLLDRPVPETAPETVRHAPDTMLPEHPLQLLVVKPLPVLVGEYERTATSGGERPRRRENQELNLETHSIARTSQ